MRGPCQEDGGRRAGVGAPRPRLWYYPAMTALSYALVPTALGTFGIAWSAAGLARLVLAEADAARVEARLARFGALPAQLADGLAGLASDIARYAEGEPVDFAAVPLDLAGAPGFDRDIWTAARALSHGETVTYGELAARAGHPGAAHETGAALGRNPVPLVVPCHRIVAAGGRLGGFSAPGGAVTKARLLAHERARPPAEPTGQQVFAF